MRIYELRLEHIGLRLRELRTKDAIPVHNASLKVPGLLKPAARFVDLQLQVRFGVPLAPLFSGLFACLCACLSPWLSLAGTYSDPCTPLLHKFVFFLFL